MGGEAWWWGILRFSHMTKVVIWVNFLYISNKKILPSIYFLSKIFWLGNAQRRPLHKWSIVSDQKVTVNILALGHSFPWRTTYWFTKWFQMKEKLMPNHLTFRFLIYFILQNCRKMLMLQHPVELGKIEKKSWIRVIKSKWLEKKFSNSLCIIKKAPSFMSLFEAKK